MRKLRPDGSEVFSWSGTVLRCDAEGIVLRAEFNVPLVELGYTTFRQGDVFREFYYWARWYNVFEVREPDGSLKGWYANVGAPAELDVARAELRYVDLAIDLWADPNGRFRLLDEDEFAAHVASGDFPPPLVEGAWRGRDELVALAQAGRLPTWEGASESLQDG